MGEERSGPMFMNLACILKKEGVGEKEWVKRGLDRWSEIYTLKIEGTRVGLQRMRGFKGP